MVGVLFPSIWDELSILVRVDAISMTGCNTRELSCLKAVGFGSKGSVDGFPCMEGPSEDTAGDISGRASGASSRGFVSGICWAAEALATAGGRRG